LTSLNHVRRGARRRTPRELLTIVNAKAVFLVAMLCCLVLTPARAEVRILASAGGQVGPFLDLFEDVRSSGERVVIDGPACRPARWC